MNNSKKICICVAGYGNFGKRLCSYIEKIDKFRIKYLYHPDKEKAADYGPLGESDLEAILKDPELDAFVIATPHDKHAGLLSRLTLEGRHHIFVEKPMTASFSETEKIKPIDKVFMVGHNQRREAVFRKAKEFLDSGVIGKIVDVHFNFSHGGAYNIATDNWRCFTKRNPEGSLAVLGSHAIDTIHYLFGKAVSVYARLYNVSGKTESPDASAVMMTLANGATVFLSSNYCMPGEKYCVITGTEGIIYINKNEIELRVGRDVNKISATKQKILVCQVDTIQEELNEFADAILNGKQVETGYWEGLAVMAVLEACYQSSLKDAPEYLAKYHSYF